MKDSRDAMEINRQGIVLNAIMLAGLVAVIGGAFRRFLPGWQPHYLAGASFLVAIEAGLLHHTFRRDRMWTDELARYLVPELLLMAVLMRIATTLSTGTQTLGSDIRRWLYDPISVFDRGFIAALLIGLLVGALSHFTMQHLAALAPQPFETATPAESDGRHSAARTSEERAQIVGRISSRFVGGGVLLLLALSLEAVNLAQVGGPSLAISNLSAGAALAYLVSGFLLYSQARLALLQSRWRIEGARVAAAIPRRWTRASWVIITSVAGITVLLPRTYGLGLLDTLRGVLGLLGYALALLGYAVIWLISLIAIIPAWLLSLLSAPGEATPPPFVPPEAPPVPQSVAQEPHLVPALIFWLCMALLVGYAGWVVLQRHPGLLHALTTRGPLGWLLRRLGWLWRDTRAWAGYMAQRVQTVLRRPVEIPGPRLPALHLSRLAPRELVRYFYRSMLHRAATRGLPRRAAQTPYEYSATLAQRLPEAQEDIGELTEAFLTAHYSPRPVGLDDARRTRRPWERMRRHLRRLIAPAGEHVAGQQPQPRAVAGFTHPAAEPADAGVVVAEDGEQHR